ncbi:MAG: Ig-like domain-containing protein [Chloroflexota bacterium]|nr:Ig-like domain-containing protein [Chloroflexota bacterium]
MRRILLAMAAAALMAVMAASSAAAQGPITRGGLRIRRTLLMLSTMALSLLLASGVALAAPTTFSNPSSISIVDATSSGASAANPYPSETNVQGLSGTITDVNVKLNGYSHGFPDDVAVQVVGPDGTSVLLMSDVGGAAPFGSAPVNNINLTLDDEAGNSLYDNGYLTTGTYKPTEGTTPDCNPWLDYRCSEWVDYQVPNIWPPDAPDLAASARQLSGFDGKDPNGTWKLYVIDDTPLEAGQFAGGWSLEITTADTIETTPPKVMSTRPANNATQVAPGVNVTATFSEVMDASTISGTTFKLVRLNADGTTTRATAAVSYDAVTNKAKLDPSSNLSPGRTYKATVTTGAQDLADNPLDQNPNVAGNQSKSWKFTVQ